MPNKTKSNRERLKEKGVSVVNGHDSSGFYVYVSGDLKTKCVSTFAEGVDKAYARLLEKLKKPSSSKSEEGGASKV